MNIKTSWNKLSIKTFSLLGISAAFFITSTAVMAELSADTQSKVKSYQDKLATWAQDEDVINAIKSMNAEAMNSMNNKDWKALSANDPIVEKYISNPAGKKLSTWQQDKALGKLFIRDQKGNFVAGSKKPAIYNISDRPPFKNAIQGKTWNSKKAKKDPTTKRSSIQLSHPVVSEGKNIGIIHTAIILE